MYQIYALKCGERDTTACEFFYREPSHERITLHFFVWLILGGPHPVLVDTGFTEEDATARGLRGYVSPAAMVGRLGVGRRIFRPRSSRIFTGITGLVTGISRVPSSGSSRTRSRSGRGRWPGTTRTRCRRTPARSRSWCDSTMRIVCGW